MTTASAGSSRARERRLARYWLKLRLGALHWPARCSIYGWWLGLGLSLGDILAFGIVRGQPLLAAKGTLIAVLAGSGFYACLGALLGAVSTPIRVHRRYAAVICVAAGFSVVLAVRTASFVIRLLSGSFLSRSSLDFTLNSWEHVGGAIGAGYAVELGVVATLAVLHFVWAKRRLRTPARLLELRRVPLVASVVVVVVGFFFIGLGGAAAHTFRSEFREVADLAFATSYVKTPKIATTGPRVNIQPGAARRAGLDWRRDAHVAPSAPRAVLLVTLESVAPRFLGYVDGDVRTVTPRLDAIARRSVRVQRAWATATHSNYAQMSILSSLFPRRGETLDMYQRLDYPRVLYHDVFAMLGYDTATVSSQDENWQGMRRFQDTGTRTFYHHAPDYTGERVFIGSEHVAPDAATTDIAGRWLSQRAHRPWAMYVNFQATHFPYRLPRGVPRPYQPTQIGKGRFDYFGYPEADRDAAMNRYRNALAYVDKQLGRLEDMLRDSGQLDDTLWVITSDHGETFHEHGLVTHGRSLYEEEIRVPLLFHWPNGLEPRDYEGVASHLDILPTVLDLAGAEPHPAMQGHSLFAEHRRDRNTAVLFNLQAMKNVEGVVCFPWKLIFDRSEQVSELYDLASDPGESVDLKEDRPVVRNLLLKTLETMIDAQLRYHEGPEALRRRNYAPRLPRCPVLPAD